MGLDEQHITDWTKTLEFNERRLEETTDVIEQSWYEERIKACKNLLSQHEV